MSANEFSYLFMGVGLGTAMLATVLVRPEKRQFYGALATGAFVALANFLLEVTGARLEIYHVSGALALAGSPVSLDIGWFFLGFSYCLGYSLLTRIAPHPRAASAVYLLAGILLGCLYDYCCAKFLPVVRLGARGSPHHIAFVWLIMIPSTILYYRIILARPSRNRDPPHPTLPRKRACHKRPKGGAIIVL